MTLLSRVIAWFPFFHAAASGCLFVAGIVYAQGFGGNPVPSALCFALSGFALYGMPPLVFRVHQAFFPVREGFSDLAAPEYSPWWGGHQIQTLFITIPQLEGLLRTVPGLYSAWLRLWGARIGKDVYWTPLTAILDRPLLEVGNRVVFGHDSALCSHVIIKKRGEIKLYVARIRLGDDCVIGACSKLGPGVRVAPGAQIPYRTEGWINQEFKS